MKIAALIFWLILPLVAVGQTVRISGTVLNTDSVALPLATVLVLPDSTVTAANAEGSFAVRASRGRKSIVVTYTGYEPFRQRITVREDTSVAIVMTAGFSQLVEVTVDANRYSSEDLLQSTQTGTTTFTQKDMNGIPVLGGEADVIKTLQLLPGTVRGVEGSADVFVRGGAADQNLVLLDGAPIYNTSHLFGFMSVFNPSILDNVQAMNGGFPAEYGGRLSSILNVRTHAGLAERTKISGDVGVIASRIYLEQPLVKNKASIWLAGRRTYIDQVVKAVGEELPYFFYDINGKVIVHPSSRDNVELSFYEGEDILDIYRDRNNDGNGILTAYSSGNSSQSLRWGHTFNSGWKSSVAATRSSYQYDIRNNFEENQLLALSDIEDYSAKIVLEKEGRSGSTFQVGAEWIRHEISPNIINTEGTISELLESSASPGKLSHEVALYAQQEFSPAPNVLVNAGFRASGGLTKSKSYFIPEPRLSVRFALAEDEALKVSYSRMAQYMHRISNSAVTTPTDVWYTITDAIAPQTAHQAAVAWQRMIARKKAFVSLEGYYKTMQNLIGYEEGTNLFFNTDFESRLIQGKGKAYGVELLLRKETGRLSGWISYTLSWSRRHFDQVNGGSWFPSRYDRRHNGAIVAQYGFSKRWAASVVWEFISGARFTPIVGQYVVLAPTLTGMDLIPLYSGINAVKLADTHRLDAGIKFMSKPGRRFQWQWFAGVYNVYNRASPVGIIIEQDEDDGSLRYLQPGLFGLLPFVSYGFRL